MSNRATFVHTLNDRELCLHARSLRIFQDGRTFVCQAWDVQRRGGSAFELLEQRGPTKAAAIYNFWQMIDDMGEFHK